MGNISGLAGGKACFEQDVKTTSGHGPSPCAQGLGSEEPVRAKLFHAGEKRAFLREICLDRTR